MLEYGLAFARVTKSENTDSSCGRILTATSLIVRVRQKCFKNAKI